MPDRAMPQSQDARTDRLNRAIDRVLGGGPAPVLDDPDLQELLSLAGRLHHELPRDLPDPVFRARLKAQLTDELPAVPLLHPDRGAVASPRHFPYVSIVAGIAAMLLAVVGVGSLALWSQDDGNQRTPASQQALDAAFTATSPLSTSALGLATATVPDIAEVGLRTPEPGATSSSAPTFTITNPTESSAETEPITQDAPAPSATGVAPDIDQTAPSSPTEEQSIEGGFASLPDVDSSTVEDGPVALASGAGEGPGPGVTFVLDTALPDLATESTAYVLSPPEIEPESLVSRIATALGIDGDVQVNDVTGEQEYHVDGADGTTFRWYPASGEFSFSSAAATVVSPVTADDASVAARAWLTRIGYPIEQLASEDAVQQIDDSQWIVETWGTAMPRPGFGHQLGARIIVTGDGSVISASGYWLEMAGAMDVPLVTAEEAWHTALIGDGYWADGGATSATGELRCQQMSLSHLLTDSGDGQLVLQPVVRIDGVFFDTFGSETRVSVFVQAARLGGENTP